MINTLAIIIISIVFGWLLNWVKDQQYKEGCSHEWHADQDNYCNTCVKCGARQEIYTE